MKKNILFFPLLLLFITQTNAQTISCTAICVRSITIDTIGNNHLNVTVYNGNSVDINYPIIQVLNAAGDTIANKSGIPFMFLQSADSTVTHQIPTDLDSLPSNFTGTVYVSDGFFHTLCSSPYPMVCSVGINEMSTSNSPLTIFPNPVSSITTIDFGTTKKEATRINVYDCKGSLVKTFDTFNNSFLFNCEGLEKGIYFITVDFGNKRLTKKIVVE